MQRLWALVVVTGCASGSSPNLAGTDGPPAQHDAAIDAKPIDAMPPTDGAIDATPPVDAPVTPDACVPMITELVANPAFDLAPVGINWTEVRYSATIPLVVDQTATGFAAQTGTQYAWLGGYESGSVATADDYLYQEFVVPAQTTQLVVTGYVAVGTDDSTTTVYDVGALGFLFPNAPATPPILVLDLDNTDAPTLGTWTPFSQTIVQNLSGQTLRLQMETQNDVSYATSFVFDSLSVRATHGCP